MMKRFHLCVALVLAALMLLCFVACADEELPGGPSDDSSNPPAGTEDNEPEDNKPEDNKPEDNEPEDNEPTFDVQPAENEKIFQLPLTGKEDAQSYLRLVYADAEHSRLTNIFAHHIADSGEYEMTELFRSLDSNTEDDVMVLLQWYVGPGEGGHDRPTLLLFREYNYDRNGQPTVNALYQEYGFYYEATPIGNGATEGYSSRLEGASVTALPDKPWYAEPQVLDFLYRYEDIYEREMEREPRDYQYDLIYSCIGGEEKTTMVKDLQEVIPFPWTRIRATLE
jgi:hypothetical protein